MKMYRHVLLLFNFGTQHIVFQIPEILQNLINKKIILKNITFDNAIHSSMSLPNTSIISGINKPNLEFTELRFFKLNKAYIEYTFRNCKYLKLVYIPYISDLTLFMAPFYQSTIDTIICEYISSQVRLFQGVNCKTFIILNDNVVPNMQGYPDTNYQNYATYDMVNIAARNMVLYVKDHLVDEYKNSNSFKNIASNIKPLSECPINWLKYRY